MNWTKNNYILILLALSGLVRIVLFFTTEPTITKDATDPSGYISVAKNLANLDFSNYDGGRTPGYPAIIVLFGFNYKLVILAQLIMGAFITFLLYNCIILLNANRVLAFTGGLLYSLYIPFLNKELSIATETTTIFLTTLALYLFLIYLKKIKEKDSQTSIVWLLLSISTASALATLTRPLFTLLHYFLIITILGVHFWKTRKIARMIIPLVLLVLPNLIFIQGWSYVNYKLIDNYGLSPWGSLNLSNKVGLYMESAPDEYKTLREIYIKEREDKIERSGTHIMTAWHAFDEMKTATGLTTNELYDEIKNMSIATIKHEPVRFISDTFKDFLKIWKPDAMPPGTNGLIRLGANIQRLLLASFIMVFFLTPLVLILFRRIRNHFKPGLHASIFILVIYFFALATTAASALIEPGNPRFSMVTDPWIIVVGLLLLYFLLTGTDHFKKLHAKKD